MWAPYYANGHSHDHYDHTIRPIGKRAAHDCCGDVSSIHICLAVVGPLCTCARFWQFTDSHFTSLAAPGNVLVLDPPRPLILSLLCYVARFSWSARLALANLCSAEVHCAFLRVSRLVGSTVGWASPHPFMPEQTGLLASGGLLEEDRILLGCCGLPPPCLAQPEVWLFSSL